MGDQTLESLNQRRAVAVMRQIAENIKKDDRISISRVTDQIGMERSLFYRWLEDAYAADIKLGEIADLADWLNSEYKHPGFLALWEQASLDIQ